MSFDDSDSIGDAQQFLIRTPVMEDEFGVADPSNPYASLLSNFMPQANLEQDYVVTENGLLRDNAGQLGKIGASGNFEPYTGGDVKQFLGTSGLVSRPTGTASRVGKYAKKLITGEGSAADYMTTLAGIAMLAELAGKRGKASPAWQGKVTKGVSPAQAVSPNYFAAVKSRPYGGAAMGMNPFTAAEGGLAGMAKGGSLPPRYLRGETDGMADKIPSSIDGQQPAKLSHGEFVIPADVVSHLGNGNSDAGAKVLYKMMDRVRQARTGNKKQGKQIKPEKFMPGGIAGYADGGAVAFAEGGDTTVTQGLAPWAGDYIAGPEGYLSKAWALGDKPYQTYEGPLTAGVSPIQQQAFTGIQGLGTPSQFGTATQFATQVGQQAGMAPFTPGTFGTGYTAGQISTGLGPLGSVQSYMNPYMQNVVDIQAREERRQSDIGRQAEQARLAQAGAYGGSRQAIMEAERQRNLSQRIGDIQEKGLQSAYDQALKQRIEESRLGLEAQKASEQARQFGATTGLDVQKAAEQSRQFGAKFGLEGLGEQMRAAQTLGDIGAKQFDVQARGLDALMKAGTTQQQAEQAAIDAQIRQFQEAQKYPYAQLQFQREMMQGLPVQTRSDTTQSSLYADLMRGIGGLLGLYGDINKATGTKP